MNEFYMTPISADAPSVSGRTDQWLSLVTAVERLSASESMDDIIGIVRETARAISGADGVTFVLRDGDLCHYVEENAVGPLWKGRRFPMSACISGWCMRRGEIAIIPDIYVDPRIPHDAYRPTFVKSLVMVPVRAENPLAAIGSYWGTCREFSPGEVALLEGLGRSTAAAIAAVQARNNLRDNEERLRMALAAGRLGAWELNFATGNLNASPVCKANFGRNGEAAFSYEDLVGSVHADDLRRQQEAIRFARENRLDLNIEIRTVWPNGETHWIELRGRVICDENDQSLRMIGVSSDVTEKKLAQERVERLQSELAHVGRLSELGQMSSAFAHELTQPLSAASNYLGSARRLLRAGEPCVEEIQEAIGRADAQFVRASQIIQRIRDFIGKGESVRAAEDIGSVLKEAAEIALINAKHKDVDLRFAIDADLPPALIDKVQIQQVLLNLLRNAFEAIETCEAKQVTVSASSVEPPSAIEVRVEDSGPGLSQDIAPRLFEPFVTSKANGMGVGLSICRQIVAGHGGRLWADSNKGRGAVFCFTIPAGEERH